MISESRFKPAWWLPGAHLQTIYPTMFRRRTNITLVRERLELPDGDFIDLDWTEPRPGPLAVVFHGLEGSSQSHYAGGILSALQQAGFHALVVHFRGCSGVPNRLLRSYHAGETQDIHNVLENLRQRFPDKGLVGIGYSLGGNALLKWSSEKGVDIPLLATVAISVPFDLFQAAERLEKGPSRVYQRYLISKLKRSASRKLTRPGFPLDAKRLRRLDSLREFDDLLTAPLHGFDDYRDYYEKSSCRRYLKGIAAPTLIIHARDDPFMYESSIPRQEELADSITLEISDRGGHVGFISGSHPLKPCYWLEKRIVQWLRSQFVKDTA